MYHCISGNISERFELKAVQMIIRHGDRYPMAEGKDSKEKILQALQKECNLKRNIKLPIVNKFVSEMDKIESRKPVYPDKSTCLSASLTGLGSYQLLKMGVDLGQTYVKKLKLLSNEYNTNEVKVWSTNRGRTIKSAFAFLFGFLPEFKPSQVHFEAYDYHFDSFCTARFAKGNCACKMLYDLKKNIEKENAAWVRSVLENHERSKHFKDILQYDTTRFIYPKEMMDMTMAFVCHNITLPSSTHRQCMDVTFIRNLLKSVNNNVKEEIKSEHFKKFSTLLMQPLLLKISSLFNEIVDSKSNLKFSLHSGHDTTISPLLEALGIHDGVWPPYASRINFELYRNKKSPSYYLRILYNGKDLTSLVELCKNGLEEGMCKFETFVSSVENTLFALFGTSDYQVVCNNNNK